MYFSGDHHQFADCHSNLAPVDGSSSLSFSHPSSTTPSALNPSSYLPSPSFDQDLNTRPNPYPFGSARSSSSLEAHHLVLRIRRSSFEEDAVEPAFNFRDSGSSRTGSGGGDEFNSFFSSFAFDGNDRSSTSAPPFSHPTAPSPSLPSSSSSSNLPLPSPLLIQSSDLHRPSDWNSGRWDSLNPFAAESLLATEGGVDGQGISEKPVVGFSIVKSAEESRTPQACQACRARKSKCDGQAACIRCENKGIKCIYVARSPSVRGKQIRRASSSSQPLTSCFTTEALVRPPNFTASSVIPKSDGISRSRRRMSDGNWGTEREREEEVGVGTPSIGRRKSSMGRSSRRESIVVEEDVPRRRRQRPSTDPYPASQLQVPIPFGSSRSTPPSHLHHSHSQSYPTSFDASPNLQPPHPPHRPFIVVAPNPGHQSYPPTFGHHSHSPHFDYSPFTLPSAPLPHNPAPLPPPLDAQHPRMDIEHSHLLLQHQPADASPSFDGVLSSNSTYNSSRYHDDDPPLTFQQPITRGYSFPSVWAPSSNSHLGLCPRPVLVSSSSAFDERPSSSTPTQQAWVQGSWDQFPRCE